MLTERMPQKEEFKTVGQYKEALQGRMERMQVRQKHPELWNSRPLVQKQDEKE